MKYLWIFCLALLLPLPLAASPEWTLQASLGGAVDADSNLTVRQAGSPDVRIHARYETRPFEGPLYYAVRVGRPDPRGAWELETIHHKVFLKNPTSEVQDFSVSHGYNLVTVARAWNLGGGLVRLGLGGVLGHAESTVRGRHLERYRWTGSSLVAGVERRFDLGARWFWDVEGKVSAARAVVPVAGGTADVPNFALHGLVGLGFRR
jgi:hypothetical protein